jgi:hypothetical protein
MLHACSRFAQRHRRARLVALLYHSTTALLRVFTLTVISRRGRGQWLALFDHKRIKHL